MEEQLPITVKEQSPPPELNEAERHVELRAVTAHPLGVPAEFFEEIRPSQVRMIAVTVKFQVAEVCPIEVYLGKPLAEGFFYRIVEVSVEAHQVKGWVGFHETQGLGQFPRKAVGGFKVLLYVNRVFRTYGILAFVDIMTQPGIDGSPNQFEPEPCLQVQDSLPMATRAPVIGNYDARKTAVQLLKSDQQPLQRKTSVEMRDKEGDFREKRRLGSHCWIHLQQRALRNLLAATIQ